MRASFITGLGRPTWQVSLADASGYGVISSRKWRIASSRAQRHNSGTGARADKPPVALRSILLTVTSTHLISTQSVARL